MSAPDSISNQYLEDIQANIRVRPIPWEGYVRANLLSSNEAAIVKAIEKQSDEARLETVSREPEKHAAVLIDLLTKITRDDVIKYVLSLVDVFVLGSPKFVTAMLQEKNVLQTLTKLLYANDEAIFLLAAKVLVELLHTQPAAAADTGKDSPLGQLITFLGKKLASSSETNFQDIAVQSYGLLLQTKSYRKAFWAQSAEIVPPLINIVKGSKGNLQLQYHALLIFWLLSFEKDAAAGFVSSFNGEILLILLEIAKNAVKEKLIRLAIATTVNLTKLSPSTAVPFLISNSGLSLIKTLSERKWADEELIADLASLQETLQSAFDSMTTFDEYEAEISSKQLKWSPPHRSETFWKENVDKFKQHDWKVAKQLNQIVQSSTDATVLAVACNDISSLAGELPDSIKLFEKLGTKIKVMELMTSADSEVRYEALKATQTFLAQSFK